MKDKTHLGQCNSFIAGEKKPPNHDELLEITQKVFRFNKEAAAERNQGTNSIAAPHPPLRFGLSLSPLFS